MKINNLPSVFYVLAPHYGIRMQNYIYFWIGKSNSLHVRWKVQEKKLKIKYTLPFSDTVSLSKKELEKRLAFANETNGKLKAEVSKYNKWMSEIEAAAQDRLAEKDEHIAQLEAKIVKLVTRYV